MRARVAWRILTHEVARSLLAVTGIFAAVVLVFLQLGFYSSVPRGSMVIYEGLDFDIALTSRDYTFQVRPGHFPRRRLYQALALPQIESAVPLYFSYGRWLNIQGHVQRQVFVMGVDPQKPAFRNPETQSRLNLLARADTALVDDSTRAAYGGREPGTIVEINRRATEIVGDYRLGTGFLGQGIAVVSDQTFIREFRDQNYGEVQMGLIRLKPGSDPDAVAKALRTLLPSDTTVYTRDGLRDHEQGYWLTSTSTGLVFGFGTVVAGLVGGVILFQTLSTLILRNLKEYAVLKAMGFTNGYLTSIVMGQGLLLAFVAFGPATAASFGLYSATRTATLLPVYMTDGRIAAVFFATIATAALGALLTVRILKRADPADLF